MILNLRCSVVVVVSVVRNFTHNRYLFVKLLFIYLFIYLHNNISSLLKSTDTYIFVVRMNLHCSVFVVNGCDFIYVFIIYVRLMYFYCGWPIQVVYLFIYLHLLCSYFITKL